jgi:hypothetical protein
MNLLLPRCLALGLSLAATALGAGAQPVSFSREIAPILAQKCQACHSPEKTKGGYQLHTYESARKPGSSDQSPLAPGDPKKSKLFELITTKDADDRMPQKDDPLPTAQIALIERWIKEGAKFDGPDPKALLSSLVPRRPNPNPPDAYVRPVPILAVAFSPDGRELAASGYHEITIWDVQTGKLLRRLKDVPQRTQSLAYSPDGKLLAMAGGDPGKLGEVKLFDPASGKVVKLLGTGADLALAVAFNPSGDKLAAGGSDNAICIYDVASGRQELLIEQHADWILGLTYSPDGKLLASASRDKSARIFDATTGALENSYIGHEEPVFSVAFAADGKLAYSAGRDRRIHAWNPLDEKGEKRKKGEGRSGPSRISGFEGDVLKVILSDKQLFACSADKSVKAYNAEGHDLIKTFAGHTDVVYSLAYDPAGKRLAAGSFNGQIRIWSVADGASLTTFTAAPGIQTAKTAQP